ncbi:MAG TPA: hypothetical protein VMC09_02300 [Anaerolineales bacterium]|nr:hypothetical protein [Anaerolineales bacterium]
MKRKNLFSFLLLLGLLVLLGLIFMAFYRPPRPANPTFTNVSQVRAVRVDYLDESRSRDEVDSLETELQKAGVNLVALGAGRAEWTYFPWPGHPERWSDEVKTTGHDYLLEDSTRFGKWANVSAVVDVLGPLYIQAHPEAASISSAGVPSPNLVASMELVDGQYGQTLLDMIDEIATYYPVNSITLSELAYYVDGFGPQDLAAYSAYTGKSEWPRRADGSIDIDDASIGNWRTYELGIFLDKATALAHDHGKQLYLEVRIEVSPAGQVIVENGTNYAELIKHVDRLVVRGSNAEEGRNPAAMEAIARYLKSYDQNRIILAIGLWDQDYTYGTPKDEMHSVSPAEFQYALEAAGRGGAGNLWVTPSFLMTTQHWEVLDIYWTDK